MSHKNNTFLIILSFTCYSTQLLHINFSILIITRFFFQFERDVIIWNHKKYEDKPLLTREESTIGKHRRWYNQFYSKNSPRYEKNALEW